ncbi:MAG: DNA replication/repair protein RecF [Clostridia bacterium]|nr:DNA replication/repair protein RecF [Clostridia bacterium]
MEIRNIKLYNFRNYKALDEKFFSGFNIIYGHNGQGKTNILEAVFLCASGRSHRTKKDRELVLIGQNNYYIKINFDRRKANSEIEISYSNEEKRKIKVNGNTIKKIAEMIGILNVVIFSPEDLLVIKEGPSERRRFFDITLSQIKPSYFYNLQQYSKILIQRNNLLKEIQNNISLEDTLEVWNNQLVKTGSAIMAERKKFIDKLSEYAGKYHARLTDGNEELTLKYSSSISTDYYDIGSIEKAFYKKIVNLEKIEKIKGMTLFGPQRDDYEIYINEKNVKTYGSQGQQRTAVLSVKLAEIDIMKEQSGEYPILLLDDVMSELDVKRREYLMKNLNEIQTFITCTEKEMFEEMKELKAVYYNVDNGQIYKY